MREVQERIADLSVGPGRREAAYGEGKSDEEREKVYDGLSHL